MNLRRLSPQQKIIGVNDKFGNKGIKDQQGTTRIIYDSLPYKSGLQTYAFFKDCKTRLFPLTNLPENKLQVGETITMQNYYIYLVALAGKGDVLAVRQLSASLDTAPTYRSDFDFLIGENRVLKDISVTSSAAPFNVGANFGSQIIAGSSTEGTAPIITKNTIGTIQHDVYDFKTDLIIPPGIEFWCNFKQGGGTVPTDIESATWYICMAIEGVGSILAPRTTF